MDKIVFYIAVCLLLVECSRKQNDYVLVQYNASLVYVNYPENTEFEFPFISFDHNPPGSNFSLDVKEQKNKIPFITNDSIVIIKIINDFNCRYYKDEYNCKDDEQKKEDALIESKQLDVFFCGKLSIVDGISSYLVLEEYSDDLGNIFRMLYLFNLFNYKNEQLISIVKLSCDLISTTITYMMDNRMHNNYYFTQIDYYYLIDTDSYSVEDYMPTQLAGDYVKIKKDSKVFYFSTFMIDKNGFVKPVKLNH